VPETHKSKEEHLAEAMDDLDHDIQKLSRQFGFWPTFGRGIIGALGTALGATIVVAIILYALQRLAVLPVIGEAFTALLELARQLRQ
jgi:hypothetical protein